MGGFSFLTWVDFDLKISSKGLALWALGRGRARRGDSDAPDCKGLWGCRTERMRCPEGQPFCRQLWSVLGGPVGRT